MARKFYLTTPIYYVNDQPHIGHTYTTVVADVIARFHRMLGQDVHFLTGTDEHGQKIERAAQAKGLRPIELADGVVERFLGLWRTLGITNDAFIRTTEERHRRGVEKLYQKISAAGDIYKDKYAGWYCTSCEAFYPENQVVDGRCPDQGHKVEWTEEESYFFRLSKYQEPLLKHYAEHRDFVFPESRRNEVVSFVQSGLKDLSISRSSFSWGIPLPGDPKHILYVWFEAFIDRVNTDLANDLGNLVSRTLKMIEDYCGGKTPKTDPRFRGDEPLKKAAQDAVDGFVKDFEELDFSSGLARVWAFIGLLNRFIVQNEPWKLAQDPARRWALESVLYTVAEGLRIVAVLIAPIVPQSASGLWKRLGVTGDVTTASLEHIHWGELKPGRPIARGEPLFPRIDKAQYLEDESPRKEPSTDAPGTAPSAPAPTTGAADIGIDDFARVELRTARIVAAERVQGADKLLKLTVDIGAETRTIVAGIATRYAPESLVGKTIVVVANLKPAKLRGVVSQGMLLAASDATGWPYILTTEEPVPPGLRVK